MAVDLIIEAFPEDLAAELRCRAAEHHRSIESEAAAILEANLKPGRRITISELYAKGRAMRLESPRSRRQSSGRTAMPATIVDVSDSGADSARFLRVGIP